MLPRPMGSEEIVCWPVESLRVDERTRDQHFAVRYPGLARRLFAMGLRPRAGSRMRRNTITRALRNGYSGMDRRDWEMVGVLTHPEFELHLRSPERQALDFEPVYYGNEGMIEFSEAWMDSFAAHYVQLREAGDPGGNRFAARIELVAIGEGSGAEVRVEQAIVLTVEAGLVKRHDIFASWDEALEELRRQTEGDAGRA